MANSQNCLFRFLSVFKRTPSPSLPQKKKVGVHPKQIVNLPQKSCLSSEPSAQSSSPSQISQLLTHFLGRDLQDLKNKLYFDNTEAPLFVQGVPAQHEFWDLGKIVLCKIRTSGYYIANFHQCEFYYIAIPLVRILYLLGPRKKHTNGNLYYYRSL